jgi:ADP-ribose pyrophosphatase YjhB (NUDIX family)
MVSPNQGSDVLTICAFQNRAATWGLMDSSGSHFMKTENDGWISHLIKTFSSKPNPQTGVQTCVDIIVLAKDEGEIKLLLIKRGKEPFHDCWALPGGRVDSTDKDLVSAANRELKEETNLGEYPLKYVTTVGDSHRDPRGFTVSVVYSVNLERIPEMVKAGDDAVDYKWFGVKRLPKNMAFDHATILDEFI